MPRRHQRRPLDVIGAVLMVAATSTLMLALSWGGSRLPWGSPVVVALLVSSAMLWTMFVLRLRTAAEPLIPGELLANPVVACGLASAGLAMGTFTGLTFFVPIYLELVVGLSASLSGLALIPLLVGTVTGAIISGHTMAHVRHYKRLPLGGLTLSCTALALLALAPNGLPLWALEVLFACASFGVGTSFPVTTVAIQNAVLLHQIGTATASLHFFRQLTGAVVVSVFGAIVLSGGATVARGMGAKLAPGAEAHLAASFQWVFLLGAFGVALSLLAFSLMKELPLRGRVAAARPEATAPGD